MLFWQAAAPSFAILFSAIPYMTETKRLHRERSPIDPSDIDNLKQVCCPLLFLSVSSATRSMGSCQTAKSSHPYPNLARTKSHGEAKLVELSISASPLAVLDMTENITISKRSVTAKPFSMEEVDAQTPKA
jgi:hypothetical protein